MEISESKLTSFSKFKVTSADTDMNAQIKLGSLVNFLIQSAIDSADNLGFGFDGLVGQQLFWVLSRLTVEIYRPLKWYEKIEVETWPKSTEGILYTRDFLVRDENQQVVAKATSGWLAIDKEAKRPKRVDTTHTEVFSFLKDKHALEASPEKLAPVAEGDLKTIRTTFFDIDLNKHVTSTRYVDWMIDALPISFLQSHCPSKLSINFMKETKVDEAINLYTNKLGETQFNFEGFNASNDLTSFRGKIDFE